MKKFLDAFNGLKIAFAHKAVIIQCILGIMAIIGGIIIKLDFNEWLVFILCITLVILCEVFNTAIERIGDYLNDKYDKRIETIKDLSSAAVLVSSIGALIICICVTLRRVIK